MHPLHDYIVGLVRAQVRGRHVVVIYDPRAELMPFFNEAQTAPPDGSGLATINLEGASCRLFTIEGSLLAARAAVEPLTSGDKPIDVVIYAPGLGRGDARNSLLMELEKAGTLYAPPALKMCARLVLRRRYEDSAIDTMLQSDALTYGDLAALCRGEDGGGSLLRTVFGVSDPIRILTAWLLQPATDADLDAKGAWDELRALLRSKTGMGGEPDIIGARLRAGAARFILANEFRNDLASGAAVDGPAAVRLSEVPAPPGKDELRAVVELARALRAQDPEAYIELADTVESELQLDLSSVPGSALGAVDTFRFEEVAAAHAAIHLLADGNAAGARALVSARGESFWVSRDPERKLLWEVCRDMLELCELAVSVRNEIGRGSLASAEAWVERYTDVDEACWSRLDRAQRKFETNLADLEVEIDPAAIAAVRGEYEDAVRRMSEGFAKALTASDWAVPGVMSHQRIWPDAVAARAKPTAYIFVDAMRYEMGAELAERLAATSEVQLRPAIAALPSITPVGMSALLPGSAGSFSVVQQGARIGASIDGVFLPDRSARQKFLEGKAPGVVSLNLDDVLSMSTNELKRKVGQAPLIAIHSTDIDGAGENAITTAAARRIMSRVIGDLARCLRTLAAIGVNDAVITSDHGHLFFAGDRPAAMRIDAPGGDTADLHRRCWIGRGGSTPAGTVRVAGAKLGYTTDLDFVFPISTAVFKAGGDLAFHHGGPSLQEMVVPVIVAKAKSGAAPAAASSKIAVSEAPDAITNRIFTIKLEIGGRSKDLFAEGLTVRPIVLAQGREAARAALAVGAELIDGTVALAPDGVVSVGFILTDETASSVRLQILDAATDSVLYASPADIPVKLGV
jgi:hypothetical protein